MSAPDDLVTDEGVDEASAASTAETARPEGSRGDVVGPPTDGSPAREADPAGPVDAESPGSRAAQAERGTGQQLEEGEG